MNKIFGVNTIKSYLEAKKISKLFIMNGFNHKEIIDKAKVDKIPIEFVERKKLDEMTNGAVHQGVVGVAKEVHPVSLKEIILEGKKKENPIIVMLDELNDPHNLGAILRSSDAFGVSGIVYKKKGSVSLNDTVAKVSTGATNYVKCCEVTNLTQTILKLKKEGYWVIGLDGGSNSTLKDAPSNVPLVLVVGSEGFGISRLVRENCDLIVKIPMVGHVSCLNASVACSVALYALTNR